jgi:hypothetical protein
MVCLASTAAQERRRSALREEWRRDRDGEASRCICGGTCPSTTGKGRSTVARWRARSVRVGHKQTRVWTEKMSSWMFQVFRLTKLDRFGRWCKNKKCSSPKVRHICFLHHKLKQSRFWNTS